MVRVTRSDPLHASLNISWQDLAFFFESRFLNTEISGGGEHFQFSAQRRTENQTISINITTLGVHKKLFFEPQFLNTTILAKQSRQVVESSNVRVCIYIYTHRNQGDTKKKKKKRLQSLRRDLCGLKRSSASRGFPDGGFPALLLIARLRG